MEIDKGLYDHLVDRGLSRRLSDLEDRRLVAECSRVDPVDLPDMVGDLLGDHGARVLRAVPADQRAPLAARLLAAVVDVSRRHARGTLDEDAELVEPVSRLTAVEELAPTGDPVTIRRPLTPLRDTVLMTNAPDQPAVGHEIAAEIESADRIDVVLAFIRWTGIRGLMDHLRRHTGAGRRLRIITTTYTGTTELRALEELVGAGAEVKVSYDTGSTRLHAKAWLFHRHSGMSTVYIGSSNLTFSAQVTGLEWNVRASEHHNPQLVEDFGRTFDTYWADPHFEDFDSERFALAVGTEADDGILTPFHIEPYPFQRQILERLALERRRGHPHNLVVAATGTGKTVISALDYRRLRGELDRSRLLFVAHRSEILQQSRTTFRHVLRDGAFGELWVGGERPRRWEHVFASIQSISAAAGRSDGPAIDPDRFDVVIVDEFHHSAAAGYTALLNHLRPRHLLGLTATPERADGLDILRWFGGRVAVELRLWDALDQGLLCPFHYFGVHDSTDLREVGWRRGRGYDPSELTDVYTADDIWVSKVLRTVRDKVADPRSMRALGFCVSIDHARFVASRFRRAGIEARAVTSATPSEDRRRALADLREGRVQALFTVDLFNEGVDLPDVDTVLMLRPTESATIFLQQLGRGLRRAEGKDVLTVLDFVGHHRREFRFHERLGVLTGRTRRQLESDVEAGFPYLPAGCVLDLDPVVSAVVLANLRDALPTGWRQRVAELRRLGDVGLAGFLDHTGLDLGDVYRLNRTWTELRRAAGLPTAEAAPGEARVGRGLSRLAHLDDDERIEQYRRFLSLPAPPPTVALDERTRRRIQGLVMTLLNPDKGEYASLDEATAALWSHEALRAELGELLPLLGEQAVHLPLPLGLLQPVPLAVHATYNQPEILAAFGISTVSEPRRVREGVYHDRASGTYLLFVTLRKNERDYSPTTRYLDYAISDTLFHWESQSTTSEASPTGQNLIHHRERGINVMLFVRTSKTDEYGRTNAYFCAGPLTYVEHRRERPMQITWRLHHPLPGDVFLAYRAAVA